MHRYCHQEIKIKTKFKIHIRPDVVTFMVHFGYRNSENDPDDVSVWEDPVKTVMHMDVQLLNFTFLDLSDYI